MYRFDQGRAREQLTEDGGAGAAGKRTKSEALPGQAAAPGLAPVQLLPAERGGQRADPFWFATGAAPVVQRMMKEDSEEEEEEEEEGEPILLFHGTSKEVALKLISKKTKIKECGKGELGGGFYMTHDVHQAGHIADYYCGSEGRSDSWAVIQFTVPRKLLVTLSKKRKDVSDEEFNDYYEQVKENGNDKPTEHPWTIGKIKDKKTPYMQHLFSGEGLDVLNDEDTKREIVLEGKVGIEKQKYAKVDEYDRDKDDVLEEIYELGEDEEEEEEEDEDEDEEQYKYLVSEVERAEKTKAPKLTSKILLEVQREAEDTKDDRYLALIDRLKKL